MRGLIYDFITGLAIIIGLFVVTYVMKANQRFIMAQADDQTHEEQVYYEEIGSRADSIYTVADVYGTFHQLLKNGSVTTDDTRWQVYDYTIMKFPNCSTTVKYNDYDVTRLRTIENYLKNLMATQPNAKFNVKREASGGSSTAHRITTYTFTRG